LQRYVKQSFEIFGDIFKDLVIKDIYRRLYNDLINLVDSNKKIVDDFRQSRNPAGAGEAKIKEKHHPE
jgi:hypothetical protein